MNRKKKKQHSLFLDLFSIIFVVVVALGIVFIFAFIWDYGTESFNIEQIFEDVMIFVGLVFFWTSVYFLYKKYVD